MDEQERDFLAVVGYVYLQHGDPCNAANVLEAIRVERPHDYEAATLLAYAYLQDERLQECVELTDFLLGGRGQGNQTVAWLVRSRAVFKLGRHNDARDTWKRAKQGSP